MNDKTKQLQIVVADLFDKDKSANEIAKAIGKSRSYVYDITSGLGLSFSLRDRRDYTDVFALRKQGLHAKEISKLLEIPLMTVYDKVYKSGELFNSKRRINANPFNVNDLTSQYVIGLWATDGNVSKCGSNVSISLTDEDVIAKIADWLKINYYVQKTFTSDRYVIAFGNKEVKTFLTGLGIVPNKSRTLRLNCEITPIMFRGIMDGDGCYFSKLRNNSVIRAIRLISASRDFIYQCKDFLTANNIASSVKEDFSGNNLLQTCMHYRLYIPVAADNDIRLYKLLYADLPEFCIERKQKLFKKLVQVKSREFRESLEVGNPEPSTVEIQ